MNKFVDCFILSHYYSSIRVTPKINYGVRLVVDGFAKLATLIQNVTEAAYESFLFLFCLRS